MILKWKEVDAIDAHVYQDSSDVITASMKLKIHHWPDVWTLSTLAFLRP